MVALIKSKIESIRKTTWSKIAVGAFICVALLLYALASNVAYAVSVNGEFVGYASTVSEITSAMDSVTATASGALGYEYSLESDVTYELTLGHPDESITAAVEEKLLNDIDSIGKYSIVCVNGVPFCAFESTEAASAALGAYTALFTNENTVSAHFTETVSIKVDYADNQLLAVAEDFNSSAAGVLNVETIDDITEDSVVPFDTEYIMDESIFTGDTYVETEGENGLSRIRREVTSLNGTALSSATLEITCISAPTTAIVHCGTGQRLSTGTYIWPTEGTLSSYYGYRNVEIGSTYHRGLDIAAYTGTDIYAADGGTVIYSGEFGGYGYMLQIEHDNGDITYYAHCSKLLKKCGDTVKQGELIAYVGSTGVASGSHLHFEVHPGGGDAIDPLTVLP
ncbi:MAG: peptidoglycan DD-metalloendopeptidase family protein [Clostridiales bacterium]|nr:peptidoglycan DD-metalloendopeptidase family protein [Clostridiales bacterium]